MKCYLEHEDYIEQIQMKTIKIRTKNKRAKKKIIQIVFIKNYGIVYISNLDSKSEARKKK